MRLLLVICFSLLPPLAAHADLVLRSTHTQATLLELYTSEGCSSCPPADEWYSSLRHHPELWRSVIPLGFHVDYWNYLGWEDRFAKPSYGSRQREYRQQGYARGVYTPGVFAGGREWQQWRHSRPIPVTNKTAGLLEIHIGERDFSASFAPSDPGTDLVHHLHVALLGNGLKSAIKSGENRGRELRHDFVVLEVSRFTSDNFRWSGALPASTLAQAAEALSWVAWVSSGEDLTPLQAAGGWADQESLIDASQ